MTAARTAGWLALAAMAVPPAHATPPPPPVPHTRYGPLVQCLGGYAVEAAADEAIFLWESRFTLAAERNSFHLAIDEPDPYRSEAHEVALDLPGIGTVTRLSRGRPNAPYQIEYLLPARAGAPAVLASSSSFDGSAADLAILARIRPAEPAQCGSFAAPAFAGEDPDALTWRRPARAGPSYHCQNGVGFALLPDEAVQAQWSLYAEPAARLRSATAALVVHGPLDRPDSPAGPVGARYRARLTDWMGRPTLLLARPGPRPSRRTPDDSYRYWLRIEFPRGSESAARALAGRLEFVATDDPRCGEGPPG